MPTDIQQPGRPTPQHPTQYGQGYRPGTPNTGKSSCFARGTVIRTTAGDKDIAEIAVGDTVLSFCSRSKSVVPSQVIKTLTHEHVSLWDVELANGIKLRTTCSHTFLTDRGWRRADQITLDTRLITADNNRCGVIKSVRSPDAADVYNLIVEGKFNYIAADVIAHSFSYFRALRMIAWSVVRMGARYCDRFRLRRRFEPALP